MKIEKVSKYIVQSTASRSSSGQTTTRKILMSLPRVKWIERDDNVSSGDIAKVDEELRDYFILNGKEREVLKLHEEGSSVTQICEAKVMSESSVKRAIISAKKKLALRAAKKEDDDADSN